MTSNPDTSAAPMTPNRDRIWLWLSADGNIRKWQGEPFTEGREYVRADSVREPATDGDVADLVARLRDEAIRLAGRSIDRGCSDSGIAANLADEAADTIERLSAERAEAEFDEMTRSCLAERDGRIAAEQRLKECEGMLRRTPGALNGMFSAGCEEHEGGSARRQEIHMRPAEALKKEIRAYFASAEGGQRDG